ncbi:MAG: hypothetical protein FWE53_03800 [Firmicutes bacterium]|nr:hypothetical protein [Bacillota bacterium]
MAKAFVPKNESLWDAWFRGSVEKGNYMPKANRRYFELKDTNADTAADVSYRLIEQDTPVLEYFTGVMPGVTNRNMRKAFFDAQGFDMLVAFKKVDNGATVVRELGKMWRKYAADRATSTRNAVYTDRIQDIETLRADTPYTPLEFVSLMRAEKQNRWSPYIEGGVLNTGIMDRKPEGVLAWPPSSDFNVPITSLVNSLQELSKGMLFQSIDIKATPRITEGGAYKFVKEGNAKSKGIVNRIRNRVTGNINEPVETRGTLYYNDGKNVTNAEKANAIMVGMAEQLTEWRFNDMIRAGTFNEAVDGKPVGDVARKNNEKVFKKVSAHLVAAELAKMFIADPRTANEFIENNHVQAAQWLNTLDNANMKNNTWIMPHIGSCVIETIVKVAAKANISPTEYFESSAAYYNNLVPGEQDYNLAVPDVFLGLNVMPAVVLSKAVKSEDKLSEDERQKIKDFVDGKDWEHLFKEKPPKKAEEPKALAPVKPFDDVNWVIVDEPKPEPVDVDKLRNITPEVPKLPAANNDGKKGPGEFNINIRFESIEAYIIFVEKKKMFAKPMADLITETLNEKDKKIFGLLESERDINPIDYGILGTIYKDGVLPLGGVNKKSKESISVAKSKALLKNNADEDVCDVAEAVKDFNEYRMVLQKKVAKAVYENFDEVATKLYEDLAKGKKLNEARVFEAGVEIIGRDVLKAEIEKKLLDPNIEKFSERNMPENATNSYTDGGFAAEKK